MSRTVSLIINARVRSTRVPNKMLRNFGTSCLLDIALNKLSQVATDCPKFLAAADEEIISLYQKYSDSIGFLQRHPDAVAPKQDISRQDLTFAHYKDVPTSHIMTINACCPFFNIDRIEHSLNHFLVNDFKTMTTVKKHSNIFFNEWGNPINTITKVVASQGNKDVLEMAHVFHIFDKEFFLKNGYFWNYSPGNPKLFEVSKEESLDIDEPLDFEICELLYSRVKI